MKKQQKKDETNQNKQTNNSSDIKTTTQLQTFDAKKIRGQEDSTPKEFDTKKIRRQ
jgi:hypothetical protein